MGSSACPANVTSEPTSNSASFGRRLDLHLRGRRGVRQRRHLVRGQRPAEEADLVEAAGEELAAGERVGPVGVGAEQHRARARDQRSGLGDPRPFDPVHVEDHPVAVVGAGEVDPLAERHRPRPGLGGPARRPHPEVGGRALEPEQELVGVRGRLLARDELVPARRCRGAPDPARDGERVACREARRVGDRREIVGPVEREAAADPPGAPGRAAAKRGVVAVAGGVERGRPLALGKVEPDRLGRNGRRLASEAEPVDGGVVDRDPVDVPAGPGLQVDHSRCGSIGGEVGDRVAAATVGANRLDPALAVVGEEVRPPERRGVRRAVVPVARGDRSACLGVLVLIDRRAGPVRVLGLADRRVLVRAEDVAAALVARPAEVLARHAHVQRLPGLCADVADQHLAGHGVDAEPERVPQAERPGLGEVAVRVPVEEGVVGKSGTGQRIDPHHRTDQVCGVAGASRQAVDVTVAHVERAVGSEREGADLMPVAVLRDAIRDANAIAAAAQPSRHPDRRRGRVRDRRRVALAAEQHGPRRGRGRSHRRVRGVRLDPLDPCDPGAGVVLRESGRIVRVEHVDVRDRRERRVDREPEHPVLEPVVDVAGDVDERCRQELAVPDDANHPALLGDEHRAVRGEVDRDRDVESRNHGFDDETRGRGSGGGVRSQDRHDRARAVRSARARETGRAVPATIFRCRCASHVSLRDSSPRTTSGGLIPRGGPAQVTASLRQIWRLEARNLLARPTSPRDSSAMRIPLGVPTSK